MEDEVVERIKEETDPVSPEEIVKIAIQSGANGIAYTYNEPGIFYEYVYDTAVIAKKHGLKNVLVSNGYTSKEALMNLKDLIDAANIDLKSFNKDFYLKVCGGKLENVLDSIKDFYEAGIWTELTTLVIPGQNDSKAELNQVAKFIAGISTDIPWHISRFTPNYKMSDLAPTDLKSIKMAYDLGKKAGLKYVYCGNLFDDKTQSTYCPKCGELLVWRDWGEVEVKNLINGRCGKCGQQIPGIWT